MFELWAISRSPVPTDSGTQHSVTAAGERGKGNSLKRFLKEVTPLVELLRLLVLVALYWLLVQPSADSEDAIHSSMAAEGFDLSYSNQTN